MTPQEMTQERIKRHQETIDRLREDAAWFKDVDFSLSRKPGETTEFLIAGINQQIALYDLLIERLRANDDAAHGKVI